MKLVDDDYFRTFKQDKFRFWLWRVLLIANLLIGTAYILAGQGSGAIDCFVTAIGIWWIDSLEKELSRRNGGF